MNIKQQLDDLCAAGDLLEPIEGLEEAIWNVEEGHCHIEEFYDVLIEAAKRFQAMQGGV